jgi:hypothetical protein
MGDKDTKFSLSNSEVALLKDVSFFHSKRALTDRIVVIFNNLEESLIQASTKYAAIIPASAMIRKGKISKGENYLGLPYMVLDFPSSFQKDNIFAFRTMMWWGHAFTCTLHLSGQYLNLMKPDFCDNNLSETAEDIYVCINADMWLHHHEPSNYIQLKEFRTSFGSISEHAKKQGFLKISIRIPIDQTSELKEKGTIFFVNVLNQLL